MSWTLVFLSIERSCLDQFKFFKFITLRPFELPTIMHPLFQLCSMLVDITASLIPSLITFRIASELNHIIRYYNRVRIDQLQLFYYGRTSSPHHDSGANIQIYRMLGIWIRRIHSIAWRRWKKEQMSILIQHILPTSFGSEYSVNRQGHLRKSDLCKYCIVLRMLLNHPILIRRYYL